MPQSTWKIRVPGKLMIAGEYAVLEPDSHAVVIAVDRYVTAEIKPGPEPLLSLPQYGIHALPWKNGQPPFFSFSDKRLVFVENVYKITAQYLGELGKELKTFHLTISSELADENGRKYGLGSSAAITVAAVAAILTFHGVEYTREELFKLAALSHLQVQGNGSGADIAAAVFGGWLDYTAFRPAWVLDEWKSERSVRDLLEKTWPSLSFSPLPELTDLELCVGWTKEPARTGPLVGKIEAMKSKNPEAYRQFLHESDSAVARMIEGFQSGNSPHIMEGIGQNRRALRELGEAAGVAIETEKLTFLCDAAERFGSAKPSGAGGGDCGIAFIRSSADRPELFSAWKKADIMPLDLHVSKGMEIEQV